MESNDNILYCNQTYSLNDKNNNFTIDSFFVEISPTIRIDSNNTKENSLLNEIIQTAVNERVNQVLNQSKIILILNT